MNDGILTVSLGDRSYDIFFASGVYPLFQEWVTRFFQGRGRFRRDGPERILHLRRRHPEVAVGNPSRCPFPPPRRAGEARGYGAGDLFLSRPQRCGEGLARRGVRRRGRGRSCGVRRRHLSPGDVVRSGSHHASLPGGQQRGREDGVQPTGREEPRGRVSPAPGGLHRPDISPHAGRPKPAGRDGGGREVRIRRSSLPVGIDHGPGGNVEEDVRRRLALGHPQRRGVQGRGGGAGREGSLRPPDPQPGAHDRTRARAGLRLRAASPRGGRCDGPGVGGGVFPQAGGGAPGAGGAGDRPSPCDGVLSRRPGGAAFVDRRGDRNGQEEGGCRTSTCRS